MNQNKQPEALRRAAWLDAGMAQSTEQEIAAAWNAQADELNQWGELDLQEKIEWAAKFGKNQSARRAPLTDEEAWEIALKSDNAMHAIRLAEAARNITQEKQARAALSAPQTQDVQDAKRLDWMDNPARVHIDWTHAPSWARYAAMDDDGTWHWHENEPQQRHDMWWMADTGWSDQIPVDLDWKTTLMERPA